MRRGAARRGAAAVDFLWNDVEIWGCGRAGAACGRLAAVCLAVCWRAGGALLMMIMAHFAPQHHLLKVGLRLHHISVSELYFILRRGGIAQKKHKNSPKTYTPWSLILFLSGSPAVDASEEYQASIWVPVVRTEPFCSGLWVGVKSILRALCALYALSMWEE